MNDPYQVLGLARGASDDEVASAYKKLAMQFHPDRNAGDKAAEERFKEINAARDAIKQGAADPPNPFSPGGGGAGGPFWHFTAGGQPFGNLDDILSALHAQQHQRNRDVNVECTLTLEDAFRGTEVTVNLREAAKTRTLMVKIPAGVDNGNRVRVPQAGEQNFPALQPGDLYVHVRIQPHGRFQRQGPHLQTRIEMPLFDLLLAGSTTLSGIDGVTLAVTIPADFDPDQPLRLAGQGMPGVETAARGDLLIIVHTQYPLLSAAQRTLLRRVRDLPAEAPAANVAAA